ncbi:hypothetical protein ACO0QE_004456 [Hanseniaspora vineae]
MNVLIRCGVFVLALFNGKSNAHPVSSNVDLWFNIFKTQFNENMLNEMVHNHQFATILSSLESDLQLQSMASNDFPPNKKTGDFKITIESNQIENQKVLDSVQEALSIVSDGSTSGPEPKFYQEQKKANSMEIKLQTNNETFPNLVETIADGLSTKFENPQLNMLVKHFFWEAKSRIVNIKTQIQISKMEKNKSREEAYKHKMSSYLKHVGAAAKEISLFKPEKNFSHEINNFDTIYYSKEDEKFLGNLIGMIICKSIKPLMDNGNISAASKETVNALNDIAAYLGFVAITIGICATFVTPLPLLCWASVASIGVASLALMLRIIKNKH